MLDPRVVPPGATDALAALARDELACSLLPPGTYASAARLVAGRLRPDVQHVLSAADEAEAALKKAEALVEQVGAAHSSRGVRWGCSIQLGGAMGLLWPAGAR
jgi:hypothetical protein